MRWMVGACVALVAVGVLVRLCGQSGNGAAPRKADRTQAPSGDRAASPPSASPEALPSSEGASDLVEPPSDPGAGPVPIPGAGPSTLSPEARRILQERREAAEKRRAEHALKAQDKRKKFEEDKRKYEEERRKRDAELRALGIDPTRNPPPRLFDAPELGPPVVTEEKK